MQAVAKLGQCVQRDLRLLHGREQAAQVADAKVSMKHICIRWKCWLALDSSVLPVRHLLEGAHHRQLHAAFDAHAEAISAHFQQKNTCEMRGTSTLPTALLLLGAQSEIEIMETAVAQSSGVAKQAQVSDVPAIAIAAVQPTLSHC